MKTKSSQSNENWKYSWAIGKLTQLPGRLKNWASKQGRTRRPHCGDAAEQVTRTEKASTVT